MVICIILGLLFIAMSVFLFMGKGKWLIAGFNTMSEEERAQYDDRKVCRAVGAVCALCAVLLFGMAYFIYALETGRTSESALLAFTLIFVAVIIVAVVFVGVYVNKYAKK